MLRVTVWGIAGGVSAAAASRRDQPATPELCRIATTPCPEGDGRLNARDRRRHSQPTSRPLPRPPASSPTCKVRYHEAVTASGEAAIEKQHAKGKKTARERIEQLLDQGSLRRARRVRAAPHPRLRHGEEAALRRRGRHRHRHHPRPPGRRLLAGLHHLRRLARRGRRREDHQGHGARPQDRACPIIGMLDSGGARIQEGVVALGKYGEIFRLNTARIRASSRRSRSSWARPPAARSTPPPSPTS